MENIEENGSTSLDPLSSSSSDQGGTTAPGGTTNIVQLISQSNAHVSLCNKRKLYKQILHFFFDNLIKKKQKNTKNNFLLRLTLSPQ